VTDNEAINLLTDLYAFGATSGYLLVFVSLIVLRFNDPYTPRPYRMPLNVPVTYRGRTVSFPVLGVLGFIGVAITLSEVVLTHPLGRIAGPAWIVLALIVYFVYRRLRGLPPLGSQPHDWETAQKRVLQEAEEFESLEEYELALAERDGTLGWILRVPPPAPRGATTAVRSVSALRKIVVPVIDLGASVRAVELAARLNEGRKGQMLIVYVHEIPLQAPLVMPERDPTIERALNLAAFIATQHGLIPQTKVAVARQVGHRIVEIAREEAADLIVMGVTLKN